MRKISLSLFLTLFLSYCAFSQGQFLIGPTGSSGYTGSTFMSQGQYGEVVIGMTGPTGSTGPQLTLGVSNDLYSSAPPPVIAVIKNLVPSGLPASGISSIGFAVVRGDNNPAHDPVPDFSIDANGLVGIGDVSSNNNSSHLFLTTLINDGNPLFTAQTFSNTMGMMIDQNGWVGIGSYPSIGVPPSVGIGPVGTPGNGNINAHFYVTDPNFDGNPLLAIYDATAPALVVTASANVGIGTATPSTPLHVIGNTTLNGDLALSGTATVGNHISITNGAFAGGQVVAGSNSAASLATGAQLVVQTSNSRGGIALINDSYAGWSNQIHFMDASGNTRHSIIDDNSASGPTAGNLLIIPGGGGTANNIVSIWGRLQIGDVPTSSTSASTLATDYSLYVEKGVIAEKFKCALKGDATNWSDYVFDKNYKLKSLTDVESYINSNHHLPDVPSTDDVLCDGIDMAKMDATLLQKIEELTLYMLEQQKEIEALKAQLSNTHK